MSKKVICEKCGADMKPIDAHVPVGMECPNCGWGWATSYIDPIHCDTVDYTVKLQSGNAVTSANIKAVSKISGVNILQSKKLLESAHSIICTGKAALVIGILKILNEQGIDYIVDPPFPYIELLT